MRPPREEGWFAEDLDRLTEAPRHTELIDGALVFVASPRRWWHGELIDLLKGALKQQAPEGVLVGREMTIRLDARNGPSPTSSSSPPCTTATGHGSPRRRSGSSSKWSPPNPHTVTAR